jgi:kumamolisin
MPFESKVTLPGSERKLTPGNYEGAAAYGEEAQVTLVLNRGSRISDHQELIESFAHASGLTVASWRSERSVSLKGTIAAMMKAFGVSLGYYYIPEKNIYYRGREGSILIPQELSGIVTAVLGLDNRPVAKPHFRKVHKKKKHKAKPLSAVQVAALYDFPKGLTGNGETIAIIELGGGYRSADLTSYFTSLGIKEPSISAVSVDGGTNSPGSGDDVEVLLDIEVAGAVAPGAKIVVYFAPNTDQGFLNAITQATHDSVNSPSIISISWGGPEDSWTTQSLTAMNQALQDAADLGITVTVAAGDDGATDASSDGSLQVDFPGSSPWVLSCGGTTLYGTGSQIASETVWDDLASGEGATGGGFSTAFSAPSYQSFASSGKTGRGVPDVAGNADPNTGYPIIVDGQEEVIGGTSAVAPLWAGLIALINESLPSAKPVGFANPKLYAIGESGFRDITSGSNGHYSAGAGWDACSGLGSPNGAALLKALT